MRFIVPGIPHTVTDRSYTACAYTQKVLKFCHMMHERGHEVIHIGHERSQVQCSQHLTVTDDLVLDLAYGDHDWQRHQFRHDIGDWAYQEFNRRGVEVLKAVGQPGDFLCCPFGQGHWAMAQQALTQGIRVCEPGIGYTSGHIPGSWRAYESHAVRTTVEGAQSPQNWYSRVIPNYFDAADFEYSENKSDYVLYLGRVTELKGITTCIRATEAAGVRLIIAGQGRLSDIGYTETPAHVTELGYADQALRRELMRDARALIIATTYLEPFGGVVVEALLSGTPIITPFFGAFEEINQHGVTGFKCHTLRDFKNAILNAHNISPVNCRYRGVAYTFPVIAPQFESWFEAIDEVYTGQGWSALE
jgi:glycosyltransferase involved in cell wall biosynthesis